jgi:hypothetical protein
VLLSVKCLTIVLIPLLVDHIISHIVHVLYSKSGTTTREPTTNNHQPSTNNQLPDLESGHKSWSYEADKHLITDALVIGGYHLRDRLKKLFSLPGLSPPLLFLRIITGSLPICTKTFTENVIAIRVDPDTFRVVTLTKLVEPNFRNQLCTVKGRVRGFELACSLYTIRLYNHLTSISRHCLPILSPH